MKKYEHKLIIFDRLVNQKALNGRENVSREILFQEILDDLGEQGYTFQDLRGDIVATREIE